MGQHHCKEEGLNMNRFFVEPEKITSQEIVITGSDVNHIRNVLRLRTGEEIEVTDGSSGQLYRCSLAEISSEQVVASIIYCQDTEAELSAKLYLFQGLPKADKMELIVQKAVELGAYELIPVANQRSVVKLTADKASHKVKRWNMISESAAKQSGRGFVPEVHGVLTMKQALEYTKEQGIDLLLFPYELAKGMETTKEVFARIRGGMKVGIFIGPEGGFAPEEVAMAEEAGAQVISLGRRILRTETAGLAILSALMMQLEMEGSAGTLGVRGTVL